MQVDRVDLRMSASAVEKHVPSATQERRRGLGFFVFLWCFFFFFYGFLGFIGLGIRAFRVSGLLGFLGF